MNNNAHKEFQEIMRLLVISFTEELADRVNEIEVMWNRLQTEWDMKALQALHRSVHNLVGTGKTFGFPEISIEARTLEQVLKSLMQKEVSADALQSAKILQQILELKRISVEEESKPAKSSIQIVTKEDAFLSNSHSSNLIFVVDDDVEADRKSVV